MRNFSEGNYETAIGSKASKPAPPQNKNLLKELQQKMEEIGRKITLIKECEALGLTVST